MRILVLVLFMLTTRVASASEGPKDGCHSLVPSTTQNFIAYMEQLLDLQVVNLEMLNKFNDGLSENKVTNILKESSQTSQNLIHGRVIQEFINSSELDTSRIKSYVTEKIETLEGNQQTRDQVELETKEIRPQFKFATVPGGNLNIVSSENMYRNTSVTVSIPTFETMTTHVTQAMWLEIMGDLPLPSKLINEGIEMITVRGGRTFIYYPNAPVTNITWWSMLVFANELSKLHGLEPAYDFSSLGYDPKVQAAVGKFNPEPDLKIEDFTGKLYERMNSTTGYRLPTYREKMYLFDYLKLHKYQNPTGNIISKSDDLIDLSEYGWIDFPKSGVIRDVGEKRKAFQVGENSIEDLVGNVHEALGDPSADPKVQNPYSSREPMTFQFSIDPTWGAMPLFGKTWTMSPNGLLGFRLSRTLSPVEVKP